MSKPRNYFVLDPREATVSDLIRLLFSSNLANRKFIHSSEDRLEDDPCRFRVRWIIFVSIVVQKLLILLKKPLYYSGFFLIFGLNLLSSNGGFFMILPNLFKGQIFFWLSCSTLIVITVVYWTTNRFYLLSFNSIESFEFRFFLSV